MEEKTLFDSLTAAEITLEVRSKVLSNKMCSVYKENCIGKRCMSYYNGKIVNFTKDKFKVHNPCCSCSIVTGVVYHEEA